VPWGEWDLHDKIGLLSMRTRCWNL